MRRATYTGFACLLTAALASAQPPGAAAPPSNLPVAAPEATTPSPNFDLGTAPADWSMTGPRLRATAQYSLWWITPMNMPDLIQTVPAGIAQQSVLSGTPLPPGSTTRYFPETRQLEFGAFSGTRVNVGGNFDRFGLEADFLYLPEVTKSSSLFNAGVPVSVAQSYIRAGTNEQITLLASLAGTSTGGIRSEVSSQLWGAELNARLPFYNFLTDSTDAVVGFRYLDLQESLNNYTRSDQSSGTVVIRDAISTTNRFYGGQVGLNGRINGTERGCGLDTSSKLALGGVRQEVNMFGSNTLFTPGSPPSVEQGGLYARGASVGNFSRDKVAMIFEQTINLTYNFNERTQVFFGYSIIWISSVQRPGEAIDPYVNDSNARFVANPPLGSTINRPAFNWNANDLWTQGMNFGFRLQY